MIFAAYDKSKGGVHVVMTRNDSITEDMEEIASIITSFKRALYSETPKEIADMMITTIGRMAYAYDEDGDDAMEEAMMELHNFMKEDAEKRYGIDLDALSLEDIAEMIER